MKILNDIAYNLNWISIQFNTYLIEFKFKKWDANWCTRHQKSDCEYDVGEKKAHSHSSSLWNWLNMARVKE